MLQIRKAQLHTLCLAAEQRFVEEFLASLDRIANEEGLVRPPVDNVTVFAEIANARSEGFASVADITSYLLIDSFLARRFSSFQHLRTILDRRDLSPGERIDRLMLALDEYDWHIVALSVNAREVDHEQTR